MIAVDLNLIPRCFGMTKEKKMTPKEKFEAELEAWMDKWGTVIEKLESGLEAELGNENALKSEERIKFKRLETSHAEIKSLRDSMRETPEEKKWVDMKTRVEKMMGDIDDDFRSSLAYFH